MAGLSKTLSGPPIGGGAVLSSSGNNATVEWANTPNSTTKRIRVSVTYTHATFQSQTFIKEEVVVVKHIGPILEVTLDNGNPSDISTNGGTTSLSCGVQSFTASVQPPVTDPSTDLIFTWTIPGGWGGSSTTDVINLTTDAGSADVTLVVSARRDDGSLSQTFTVHINRPQVTSAVITTADSWSPFDKPLCSGESRDLSGSTSGNATSFSWSVSGGLSIVSGGSSSVVEVSGTGNGILTLTANNGCGVPKIKTRKIFAGTPQLTSTDVLVDGHPNYYPNYTSGSSYISLQNEASCQTYKWELYGGSGYINASSSCGYCNNVFNGITFNQCNSASASTSSSMAIRVRTANRCGQGADVIIPLETSGGGGYYRMASPNPGKDRIVIQFDKEEAKESLEILRLVGHNRSQIVRDFNISEARQSRYFEANETVIFEVGELPRGIYHLLIKFKGQSGNSSEMIMLE
jgi:hypothetical protein